MTINQPVWARRLWWFVGVPAWLVFTILIVTGKSFEMQWLAIVLMVVFAVPVMISSYYFWRGKNDG